MMFKFKVGDRVRHLSGSTEYQVEAVDGTPEKPQIKIKDCWYYAEFFAVVEAIDKAGSDKVEAINRCLDEVNTTPTLDIRAHDVVRTKGCPTSLGAVLYTPSVVRSDTLISVRCRRPDGHSYTFWMPANRLEVVSYLPEGD